MTSPCRDFRSAWLERALDETARRALEASGHLAACESCAVWLRAVATQVDVLRSLERQTLPRSLDEAVEADLSGAGSGPRRIERALRDLPRLQAPTELEELVERALAEPETCPERPRLHESARAREGEAAESVRMLDFPPVPAVLERLVSEELSRPAAHRVERFVGDLEPQRAPEVLESRVRSLLRRRRVRGLAGLATLAAACLALWLGVRTGSPESRGRRLTIVRVDGAGDLSPLARGLVESLRGGVAYGGADVSGPGAEGAGG